MMIPAEIPHILVRLGELIDPAIDLRSKLGIKAVQHFQKTVGLVADGILGPKTIGSLEHYRALLTRAPKDCQQLRAWRFTNYYLAEEKLYKPGTIPIYSASKQVIARVSAGAFAKLSLEGSGFLRDDRLINVSGSFVPVVASDGYAAVAALAERNGWLPRKAGYAGIRVREVDHGDNPPTWIVTHALAFHLVTGSDRGIGYGSAGGKPCVPFKTMATDTGQVTRSDPRYKGSGGVIPRGTTCWIPEFVGVPLPDGSTHDGFWLANDSGGGIVFAHSDLFVGTAALHKAIAWPTPSDRGYLWFPGIEKRLPVGYDSES